MKTKTVTSDETIPLGDGVTTISCAVDKLDALLDGALSLIGDSPTPVLDAKAIQRLRQLLFMIQDVATEIADEVNATGSRVAEVHRRATHEGRNADAA